MLHDILMVLVGLIIGAVIGFFVARKVMEKYLCTQYINIILGILKDMMKINYILEMRI